jgi:putative RNA 2'-phosphotransferase
LSFLARQNRTGPAAARFVPGIMAEGLRPGKRIHVHLSPDIETARVIGARRGVPVILTIRAGAMYRAGHSFYLATNGVWLTGEVPPVWIMADSAVPGPST